MFRRLRLWRNRKQPVYVVAGFQRSGTTMMMRALEAGGLKVDRAPASDPRHDDYELGAEAYASVTHEAVLNYENGDDEADVRFPRAHRGRLIKVLVGGVQHLYPQQHGIVCVFMHRDWESISASYEARNGIRPRRDWAEKAIAKELSRWRGREDVRLFELLYSSVILDPTAAFECLKDFEFPIRNVSRASVTIDPPEYPSIVTAVSA